MSAIIYKNIFNEVLMLIVFSVVLTFTIECIVRSSLKDTVKFIMKNRLWFFTNILVVLMTFSISLLTTKKIFAYIVITTLWLIVSITNYVLIELRGTPFNAKDMIIISDALRIITIYFSILKIVLLVIAAVALVSGLVVMYIVSGESVDSIHYLGALLIVALIGFIFLIAKRIAYNKETNRVINLNLAYDKHGFAYGFIQTIFSNGIRKPKNYTDKTLKKLNDKYSNLNKKEHISNENKPNIIMVQLEAFFDPKLINNAIYSDDPIPNFRKLCKEYSSGYVEVPVLGGGTLQSEFESITGMSLQFFGLGEYPYCSILSKKGCETIASNLKKLGYSTHVIHNNDATFYKRHKVFEKLGFDTFTSIEYMKDVERIETGWAKDKVLVNEITSVLNSSRQKKLVYTITVQDHGVYPKKEVISNPKVKVTGKLKAGLKNGLEYYANQIRETDKFILDLIDNISKSKQETVIVFFGDHLPGLNLRENDINNKELFKTPYCIWDNIGLKKCDKNLKLYQLGAEVLKRVDISTGVINKLHQNNEASLEYLEELNIAQYDMLYGKRYLNNNKDYETTNLKMGVDDIEIDSIKLEDGGVKILGRNFTNYSKVFIDGKRYDTTFIDDRMLVLKDTILEVESKVVVKQIDKYGTVLSKTNEYIYK